MNELPFLIIHGGWIWLLGIPPVLVLTWLLLRLRLRRKVLVRARSALRAMGSPTPTLFGASDGVEVVIQGTLRCQGGCSRYLDGEPVAAATFWWGKEYLNGTSTLGSLSRRADNLYIDVGDASVEVVGDVSVTVGVRSHMPGMSGSSAETDRRLCADAKDKSASAFWRDRPLHTWLCDGDVVVARGRLRRGAARDDSDYRSSASGFRLEAVRKEAAVQIVSCDRPVVTSTVRSQFVSTFLGGGLLFIVGSYLLGHCAIQQVDDEGYVVADISRPFELPEVSWMTIAAAAPFHRKEALDELSGQLRWSVATTDRHSIEAQVQLWELRGQCRSVAKLLHDSQQHRRALAKLEQCGEPTSWLAARAHAALGEMSAASDVLAATGGRFGGYQVAIHVMANQWSRAAAAAQAHAAWLRGDSPVSTKARAWDCVALGLLYKSGDESALQRMRDEAEPGGLEACTILVAELSRSPESVKALSSLDLSDPELNADRIAYTLSRARNYLLVELQPDAVDPDMMVAPLWDADVLLGSGFGRAGSLGLLLRGQSQLSQVKFADSSGASKWLASLALWNAQAGDYGTAQALMSRAEASVPHSDSIRLSSMSLALRMGNLSRARALARESDIVFWPEALIALAEGEPELMIREHLMIAGSETYASLARAVRLVVEAGDGDVLRPLLRRRMTILWRILPILARHVRTNRGSLADFARFGMVSSGNESGSWLVGYGTRLFLAEGLGDDALAAEFRELAQRHFDLLTAPEFALFLYLIRDLSTIYEL